jgi:predicted SprT family Zn-dependent metalloprotease
MPAKSAEVSVVRHNIPAPTQHTYTELQRAYDHFNKALFDGRLPHCLIVLHRKKNAYGYFWAGMWDTREGGAKLDEIALNPSLIRRRTDREALSTLVHEMVHLEQQHFGKPGKNGNHNREWGTLMDRIGLAPSSTGAPGGKRTGTKVSHYIVDGGLFDAACAELLKDGFVLPYMERAISDEERNRAKAKRASKTKFCCPTCDAAAWGKPTLLVMCGECDEMMIAEEKD